MDGKLLGTNYGVTPSAYKEYFGESPSEEDMRNLTKEQAEKIYMKNYIKGPKINQLPSELVDVVADMSVNAGPSRAIKLLQKVLGIKEDGVIGPVTIKAAEEDPDIINKYVDERIKFYRQIASNNPSQAKFLKGWINRAEQYYA